MMYDALRLNEDLDRPTGLGFAPAGVAVGSALGLTSGIATFGIGTGITLGIGLLKSIFGKTARNKPYSDARDANKNKILEEMDALKAGVDACQITPDQALAAAQKLVTEYYSWCDSALPSSIADSCRNFERQDYPGGAQEGGFKTREGRISAAGADCAAKKAAAAQTAGASDGSGGTISNLLSGTSSSTILLLGALALLLLKD